MFCTCVACTGCGLGFELPELLVDLLCRRRSAAWAAMERVSDPDVLNIDCHAPLKEVVAGACLLAGWQSWSLVWRCRRQKLRWHCEHLTGTSSLRLHPFAWQRLV